MKIKLIDMQVNDPDTEVVFGTCELCMSTGYAAEPIFKFQDANGKKFEVNGYWWDWGDYDDLWIDNVVNFDAWLIKQDFPADIADTANYGWLDDLTEKYRMWEEVTDDD